MIFAFAKDSPLIFLSAPHTMKFSQDPFRYTLPVEQIRHFGDDRKRLRDYLRSTLPDGDFVAPSLVSGLIRLAEFLSILLVSALCAWRYPGFGAEVSLQDYGLMALAGAVWVVLIYEGLGLNRLAALLNPLPQLSRIVGGWMLVFAAITAVVFLTKAGNDYSRIWLILWATIGLFFIVSERFFAAAILRHLNKQGQLNRRAVLVGGGDPAASVIGALEASHDTGISLLGIFDDRDDARAPSDTAGLRKLGTVDDLIEFVRNTRIDTIILTLPTTAEARLLSILNRLWVLPVDIRISAYGQKLRYRPRAYSYIGNLPCLDVFDRPLGDWGPFVKGVSDKILAVFAIVTLSPVMAAVALAVKMDSKGPVLFKQKRYGFNNELVEVFKFRSMYTELEDAAASRLVTKDDPRVTKVGRFIRKTSLDELPQLFNVLTGVLSLVGPRPHATKAKANGELYEQVVDGYFARHKVKPGITGWAQINGWRGETETEEQIQRRVDHDLYYIENWSLTFDLYILARTPFSLLNNERAY